MANKATGTTDGFGFFTIVDSPHQGLVGGLLVLNAAARPLEFHCTAPVTANRAQQILYGPTLASYLYGEQIGATLLRAAKNPLVMVATDVVPALSVRDVVDLPVILVHGEQEMSKQPPQNMASQTIHFGPPGNPPGGEGEIALTPTFEVRQRKIALSANHSSDRSQVEALCETMIETFDLTEPFDRIREAIAEAQVGAA